MSTRGRASFNALPGQPIPSYVQEDPNGPDASPYDGEHYSYDVSPPVKYGSYVDTRSVPFEDGPGEYFSHYRGSPPESHHMGGQHHQPMRHWDRPNYKPSALRWPFLTFFLFLILAMVGILAYALHVLPVQDMHPIGPTRAGHGLKRQVTASETQTSTSAGGQSSGTAVRPSSDFGQVGGVTITSSSSKTQTTTFVGWAPQSDYGKAGESVTITSAAGTAPGGDFGKAGESVTVTQATDTAPGGNFGSAGGAVSVTSAPQTPTFVTAVVTTLTNSLGVPTYTATSIPAPLSTPQVTILTNSLGEATATQTTDVLVTPSVRIETDANGVPTATVTSYPVLPSESPSVTVYYISYGQYFIGFFLPTVVAILLSIPVRIIDRNAKLFQPWHELTHARGATGRESLCLQTSGWQSVVTSVRSLFGGQALVFLTTALVLCSALLVPLSAESVAFDVVGGCQPGSMSARNCAYVLSVFAQPAKATLGLLAFMGVTVLFIIGFLVRWRSGVSTNPWSICGIASLSHNPDVKGLFASLPAGLDAGKMPNGLLEGVLLDRRFKLGEFQGAKGNVEYGIMLHDEYPRGHPLHTPIGEGAMMEKPRHHRPAKMRHHLPFLMLGYPGRFLFLFILCGLLALILYYNNTGGDTPFEHFMDSESFGVRFLFTGVGVLITFFWSSFFSSIAAMSPYHLLASGPQYARHSILLSPPTNAFSGIYSGIRRHHGFLSVVALATVLSEFLTVFLCNVPFRVTQTFLVARICTWSAVGILCIMILVVVGSFFVKWPHMPLDPSTIAGAMYYICDSWMGESFEGTSVLDRSERDWKVNEMGLRYEFGEMTGVSGTIRIGVDIADGTTI